MTHAESQMGGGEQRRAVRLTCCANSKIELKSTWDTNVNMSNKSSIEEIACTLTEKTQKNTLSILKMVDRRTIWRQF